MEFINGRRVYTEEEPEKITEDTGGWTDEKILKTTPCGPSAIFSKGNKNSRKRFVLEWNIGTPTEHGDYLVSMSDGKVYFDRYILGNRGESSLWENERDRRAKVIAWVKLSDIKPYKE